MRVIAACPRAARVARAVFAVASVLVASCAAGLPEPTSEHLRVAQRSEPNLSLEDLSRGRRMYVSNCGGCHALRAPESLPAERWQHELDEMERKQGVKLSAETARDIMRYLTSVSQAGRR